MGHPIWPLFDLEVRTPTLTLRYVDDELAAELAELATEGIHDPARTPFSFPWTDVAPPRQQRNTMQYYWRCRAETTPTSWNLGLAVDVDGSIAGVASIESNDFASLRQVVTGSWLGRGFQGRGIGKEMRIAALTLAFDGFDADRALTGAWHDNAASLGVTRSLGYTETGRRWALRRDRSDLIVDFEMQRGHFDTLRRSDITLHGVDGARDLLEVAAARPARSESAHVSVAADSTSS